MKRFGNEKLSVLGSKGIRRIDKVHAELDGALQNALGFFAIFRPTPDTVTRDAHRAEPEPVHGKIPADFKCAAGVRFSAKQIGNGHHRQSDATGQTQPGKFPSIHFLSHTYLLSFFFPKLSHSKGTLPGL